MRYPRKRKDRNGRRGSCRPKRPGAVALSPEGRSLPRRWSPRRLATTSLLPPISLLLTILVGWTTTPVALARTTTRPSLSDLTSRLERVEADLGDARKDAAGLAAALAEADRRLTAAERGQTSAQQRFTRARRRSVEAAETLSHATTEVWRQEERRGRQARNTYMTGGPLTQLGYLLSASSMAEAGRRYAVLSRVARDANDNLSRLRDARRRVASAHAAMVAEELRAAADRATLAERIEALDRARAGRGRAKRALDARIAALSSSKARLQERALAQLEAVRQRDATAHRRLVDKLKRNAKLASLAEASGKARRAAQVARGRGRCDLSGLDPHERFLILRESGGNPTAGNAASTAFGLGQLTLANRMRYLGADHSTTDCGKQLRAFRAYVANAYGSARAASAFWRTNGWY